MRTFLRLLVLPALLALAAPVRADEPNMPAMPEKTGKKIENPIYTAWAKFKVGAWVRHVSTTEAAGQTTKQTITQKLVELTEAKAVVEMVMSMEVAGQKMDMPASRTEHEKMMDEYKPTAMPEGQKPTVKEGEEKLSVAGKELACKTVESSGEASGTKYWSKIWTCADVPGGQVQMETKSEAVGMNMVMKSTLDAYGDK